MHLACQIKQIAGSSPCRRSPDLAGDALPQKPAPSYAIRLRERVKRHLRVLRGFALANAGATAVEFALLLLPFLLVLLASTDVGVKAFIQGDLDRVLEEATNNLALKANEASSASKYKEYFLCGALGPLLNCDDLEIGATVVGGRLFDYRNKPLSGLWSLGCGGDTVLVELTYPYEQIIAPFAIADIIEVEGKKRFRSRAVVLREPILTGAGACSN
ncbi:TadE/TadG family type IV pilus assembly protein [Devosia sp. FKR38]|uniref:TadE/TadG family type IV pilus assembly protein n=1 Tax=Devosia sp. FKR38 TaxID=2562312 RepID=UPI0014857DC0|nr:TadE/TadG family type IV pilus assembly protein [Devosia sp. FKR38]